MKPYRYLLLTTVSLSLFACGGEDGEDPIVPPVDPDTPVALSPQIASVALTKATATSGDIKAIGLYAVNNVASENHYGTSPPWYIRPIHPPRGFLKTRYDKR